MGKRIPLIAGNWKMHKILTEAVSTAGLLVEKIADLQKPEVMIAPTFTSLSAVAEILGKSPIALGAQNLFWEKEGAYTGEISADMLVSLGCSYGIIGHSERRQYFGETDETCARKIKAALDAGLKPIYCIGESESEREAQKTFSVLDKQIKNGLKGFVSADLQGLVIAYEPIWAIGTGKTATPEQVQEVHHFIRSQMGEKFGTQVAENIRLLYGGSVKPDNITGLMALEDVDGALVGGASLDAETFSRIIHYQ
jgi:triosephosphate isomerase